MKITNGSITLEIEDVNAATSSYLAAALSLMDTDIILDITDSGSLTLDVPTDILKNFIDFISGGNVARMDEDDEEFFSFMGFPNTYGYPLSYWRIKVRDDWIRDNFKLWRDEPYYNLVPISMDREVLGIVRHRSALYSEMLGIGLVIGGTTALYMHEGRSSPHDHGREELFVIGDFDIGDLARDVILITHDDKTEVEIGGVEFIIHNKIYESPSQVAHSQEIDCLGVVYDGINLWATERALHSIREKVNWIDPPLEYIRDLVLYGSTYDIRIPEGEVGRRTNRIRMKVQDPSERLSSS